MYAHANKKLAYSGKYRQFPPHVYAPSLKEQSSHLKIAHFSKLPKKVNSDYPFLSSLALKIVSLCHVPALEPTAQLGLPHYTPAPNVCTQSQSSANSCLEEMSVINWNVLDKFPGKISKGCACGLLLPFNLLLPSHLANKSSSHFNTRKTNLKRASGFQKVYWRREANHRKVQLMNLAFVAALFVTFLLTMNSIQRHKMESCWPDPFCGFNSSQSVILKP